MPKSDRKVQQYRNDGMAKALEIVKAGGVEALEKEVTYRNARFYPLELTPDIMKPILEEQSSNLQDMLAVCFCMALYDAEHFGMKRLNRVVDRFNYFSNCSLEFDYHGEHYVKVSDFSELLNEECKSHFDIEAIRRIEEMEERTPRKNEGTMASAI